jgi:hypothetical protein
MADECGDSRVSSFLVGFLVGSLLAGGVAAGYFVWQERQLARDAAVRQAQVYRVRLQAAAAREQAETERDLAEEALKKAKEE